MNRVSLWTLIVFFVLGSHPLIAADLSKIDRKIGKEPAYQSKPKYCLVVYGPEARTRVWLVLDGDVLYADRNGDGDLTAGDKRIRNENPIDGPVFRVGNIPARDGGDLFSLKVNMKPELEVGNKDIHCVIWCEPEKGKGFTQRTDGTFQFADKSEQAPIVHFGGPLTLTILDWHRPDQPRKLVRGDKEKELSILVGTPVFGDKQEAFATVYGDRFQQCAHVEVAFPGKEPSAKPILLKAAMRY
jgi:hypothetical protein